MFKKILIANRGEIAVRIVRACRELGIRSVVAYSEADRDSLAVRLADEAMCIGPARSGNSYLNIPAIVTAALLTGADAIHPGYGFVSENPYFAEICEKYGTVFIGPRPAVMELMGDKAAARRIMAENGLPVIPGAHLVLEGAEQARNLAAEIGYPVVLKASAGGGGRGLRVVETDAELVDAFPVAYSEAQRAFGNPDLYLEKFVVNARHVEVQLLGDNYGRVVAIGERDCSIQRRHQKLIEEAPAVALSPRLRSALHEAAVSGASAIGYSNAGTVEFLVGDDGTFYFMEMNTRLQVEHPVTEMISALDLVKWQIALAAGERLTLQTSQLSPRGHAIECRINAEDPSRNFTPDSGRVELWLPPGGPGVRVDSHLYSGYTAPAHYDSLLAKIVAWGPDRAEAIARMRRALAECVVVGIKTTIPFHRKVLANPAFVRGEVYTDFVQRHLGDLNGAGPAEFELADLVEE